MTTSQAILNANINPTPAQALNAAPARISVSPAIRKAALAAISLAFGSAVFLGGFTLLVNVLFANFV